jgi:hypothetical protein
MSLPKIDNELLESNRQKLIAWQQIQHSRNVEGTRLHLGSGHAKMPGYINVDLYAPEADRNEDFRHLSDAPNSVAEICTHHAIEHIPVRDIFPTFQHWFEILAPGGTLECGSPDLELMAQSFLEGNENKRWTHDIWTLQGSQTEDPQFAPNGGFSPRDYFPFSEGQVHTGCISMGTAVRMLEDIGFRMIDADWYDANGAALSWFIYCEKPLTNPIGDILERDCVIGTFTNKTLYLPQLWASAKKQIPQVQFITRIQRGPINVGMSLLREDFIKSGKRYAIFLDDDIVILNPDIVKNSLRLLVNEKFGEASVYSTFEKSALTEPYNPNRRGLKNRQHKWSTGYWKAVDLHKVGHILPDMNLPYPNLAVDTSYSVAIRAAGFEIGISADYVYHVMKDTKYWKHEGDATNAYLKEKWSDIFYHSWASWDGNVLDWQNGQFD